MYTRHDAIRHHCIVVNLEKWKLPNHYHHNFLVHATTIVCRCRMSICKHKRSHRDAQHMHKQTHVEVFSFLFLFTFYRYENWVVTISSMTITKEKDEDAGLNLTDDEVSDSDGDECLMGMKRRRVRLQRLQAPSHVAQIQMLHRRPLHGSSPSISPTTPTFPLPIRMRKLTYTATSSYRLI